MVRRSVKVISSRSLARPLALIAVGALVFVTGFGLGRGSRTPDSDLALVGEVREQIDALAIRSPEEGSLAREAIRGMLAALEDTYAEYLPRDPQIEEPEGMEHRILGVEVGALSEAAGLRGRVVEPGIGQVGLRLFSPGSGALARAEVERLVQLGVEGIILDLRGNPGGLIEEALEMSGIFVGEREVFRYETASGGDGGRHGVGSQVEGIAVVVLVDGETGSAAELVAGAIQDHGIGLVVGERSRGKATAQRIVSLSDGSALKLTTAEYRTPSGRKVDGVGIRPDVVVSLPTERQLTRAISVLRATIGG